MSKYSAEIVWSRGDQDFLDNQYSRRFVMRFDGGIEVPGSSSPSVVPVPRSDAAAVDPEEAFVASLSSCHMLWFLSLAAEHKYCVDRYVDSATGVMTRNASGKYYMSVVSLRPQVTFSGDRVPTREELEALHHQAHDECFIANSVITEVQCHPLHTG